MGDTWDPELADEWHTRAPVDISTSDSGRDLTEQNDSAAWDDSKTKTFGSNTSTAIGTGGTGRTADTAGTGDTAVGPTVAIVDDMEMGSGRTPQWQRFVRQPRRRARHLEEMFQQPILPSRDTSDVSQTSKSFKDPRQELIAEHNSLSDTTASSIGSTVTSDSGLQQRYNFLGRQNTYVNQRLEGIMQELGENSVKDTTTHSVAIDNSSGQRRDDVSATAAFDSLTRDATSAITTDNVPLHERGKQLFDKLLRTPRPQASRLTLRPESREDSSLDALEDQLTRMSVTEESTSVNGGTLDSIMGKGLARRSEPVREVQSLAIAGDSSSSGMVDLEDGSILRAEDTSASNAGEWNGSGSLRTPLQSAGASNAQNYLGPEMPISRHIHNSIRGVNEQETSTSEFLPGNISPIPNFERASASTRASPVWEALQPTPDRYSAPPIRNYKPENGEFLDTSIAARDVSFSVGARHWAALLRKTFFDPKSEVLDISDRGLESLAMLDEFVPQLRSLLAERNALTQLEGLPRSLLHADFAENMLGPQVTFPAAFLTVLDLRYNHLTDLRPLRNLKVLNALDVSNNCLVSLRGISDLPSLRSLQCSNNRVRGISFKSDLLEEFDASGNQITTVQLDTPNLRDLKLDDNNVMVLNPIPSLQTLWLRNNGTAIDFGYGEWSMLRELRYDGNPAARGLSGLNLSSLSWEVASRVQGMSNLSLSVTSELCLGGGSGATFLASVDTIQCIQHLDLIGCGLQQLPEHFAEIFPSLLTLNFAGNNLSNDCGEILAKLPALRRLSLYGNRADSGIACSLKPMAAHLEALDIRTAGTAPVYSTASYSEVLTAPAPTMGRAESEILSHLPQLAWLNGQILGRVTKIDTKLTPLSDDGLGISEQRYEADARSSGNLDIIRALFWA